MGDFIFSLVISFVILMLDAVMLFAYFFMRKKILAILLFIVGCVLVGFAVDLLYLFFDYDGDSSLLFSLPGVVYLIVGTLSLLLPFLRKPV